MRIDWRPRRFDVFVISALVVGLCLVLLVRVNNTKRGEMCQSNLKSLALALGLYIRDYDELYPSKDKWADVLLPYLKDHSIFKCPSTPQYNYAINQILSGITVVEVTDNTTTPLFFETNLLRSNTHGGLEIILREPRHPQGIGVVFTDQQVRWQKQPPQFPALGSEKPKHLTIQ